MKLKKLSPALMALSIIITLLPARAAHAQVEILGTLKVTAIPGVSIFALALDNSQHYFLGLTEAELSIPERPVVVTTSDLTHLIIDTKNFSWPGGPINRSLKIDFHNDDGVTLGSAVAQAQPGEAGILPGGDGEGQWR